MYGGNGYNNCQAKTVEPMRGGEALQSRKETRNSQEKKCAKGKREMVRQCLHLQPTKPGLRDAYDYFAKIAKTFCVSFSAGCKSTAKPYQIVSGDPCNTAKKGHPASRAFLTQA